MSRTSTVFTIGHSTRPLEEVVGMLQQHGVDLLVDVRRFPGSRAQPQWGQDAIVAGLPPDIGYRWLAALGGRRHTPAGVESPNGAWRVKAFRDYADYMATDAFRAGLHELIGLAGEATPAIMCSEAVPWRCHRRLITDALLVAGLPVVDLLAPGSARPAALSASARVEGDRITYPPE
ncbi:MAG: DUF488 domain-containing protein [Amnibacterium sp.]